LSELLLVSLPLGNPKDISLRALDTIRDEQYFFVEDTRSFHQFLKSHHIDFENKKIDSFHDHSDKQKLKKILETLNHSNVVICSEAGSPYISDPAYPIVVECNKKNIKVNSIPGPSSVITALELSGLPPIPFHFHGFVPRAYGDREKYFDTFKYTTGTHIFFEGVSRIIESIDQLSQMYPMNEICIVREMTKEFQTIYNFQGTTWEKMKGEIYLKGEFVVLVNVADSEIENNLAVTSILREMKNDGYKPKLIAKLISELTGEPVKDVYTKLSKS
jgi:16S rRNA (cytidine1402-2'-O)-methyltransferase